MLALCRTGRAGSGRAAEAEGREAREVRGERRPRHGERSRSQLLFKFRGTESSENNGSKHVNFGCSSFYRPLPHLYSVKKGSSALHRLSKSVLLALYSVLYTLSVLF